MAELDTSQKGGGKHKGGKKRSKKASTRVDLTPMVDLGFLLVTFFMLTTTFSKPQTMEINMPVKPPPGQEVDKGNDLKASKAMTVIVADSNKVYYYFGLPSPDAELLKTGFSKDGIRRALLVRNLQVKDLTVLIKATTEANYKNMVDILDEINISNIKRYALVDISDVDLGLIKKNYGG
ncbi:MAG: biopolymer transporter ExbD [Ignavibacteriales bacterium]|nr:biopolymer transporter ExbD [Ignavibacteriales bacterium]